MQRTFKATQSGNTLTISGVTVNTSGTAKEYTFEIARDMSSLPNGGVGQLVAYGSNSSEGLDDQGVITLNKDTGTSFKDYVDPPTAYIKVSLNPSTAERDAYIQKVCQVENSKDYVYTEDALDG